MTPAAEPPSFAALVRTPGNAYLRRNPRPTQKGFKTHAFWKACLPDLRNAYTNVCAYSSVWIGVQASVDHFLPKGIRPDLAYEWSNYRLALDKLNSYKGNSTDVLDPFYIQPGWFTLDFSSFFVVPGQGLPPAVETAVVGTIHTLRLNRDDALVELRYTVVKDYADGDMSFRHLEKRYPFIASELTRQGKVDVIKGTL